MICKYCQIQMLKAKNKKGKYRYWCKDCGSHFITRKELK